MNHASSSRYWRATVWCALAVLIATAVIAGKFPATGGDFAPGYAVPVYAFEFAREPSDLDLVFGQPSDPERASRIKAMDQGNYWDYLFMATYGGFLGLFFWAAYRQTGRGTWQLAAAFGVAAAICDGIENVILIGITRDLANAPLLEWLWIPVTLKFALLLACAALAGWFFHALGLPIWRRCGHGLVLLALIGSSGLIAPPEFAYLLAICIAPAWLLQLIYAIGSTKRNAKDPIDDI
ncbi:MAG: hypothetical protein AB8F65_00405 [Woeseiaceae bacterium]